MESVVKAQNFQVAATQHHGQWPPQPPTSQPPPPSRASSRFSASAFSNQQFRQPVVVGGDQAAQTASSRGRSKVKGAATATSLAAAPAAAAGAAGGAGPRPLLTMPLPRCVICHGQAHPSAGQLHRHLLTHSQMDLAMAVLSLSEKQPQVPPPRPPPAPQRTATRASTSIQPSVPGPSWQPNAYYSSVPTNGGDLATTSSAASVRPPSGVSGAQVLPQVGAYWSLYGSGNTMKWSSSAHEGNGWTTRVPTAFGRQSGRVTEEVDLEGEETGQAEELQRSRGKRRGTAVKKVRTEDRATSPGLPDSTPDKAPSATAASTSAPATASRLDKCDPEFWRSVAQTMMDTKASQPRKARPPLDAAQVPVAAVYLKRRGKTAAAEPSIRETKDGLQIRVKPSGTRIAARSQYCQTNITLPPWHECDMVPVRCRQSVELSELDHGEDESKTPEDSGDSAAKDSSSSSSTPAVAAIAAAATSASLEGLGLSDVDIDDMISIEDYDGHSFDAAGNPVRWGSLYLF